MTQQLILPLQKFTTDTLQSLPYATLSFFENNSSTPRAVYADKSKTTSLGTIVTADSAGVFPQIWLDGVYRATLKSRSTNLTDNPATGVTQTGFPIDSVGSNQNFTAYSAWDATFTYDITTNSFVTGPDGLYYQSIINPNLNKTPASNPSYWQQIYFLPQWNSTINYAVNTLVIYQGLLYKSNTTGINHVPPNASYWDNVSFSNSVVGAFSATATITGNALVATTSITAASEAISGASTAASYTATGAVIGDNTIKTAKKTAATNRISTTTLTADPDLSIASAASTYYSFRCVIFWQGQGSTTNGIKAQVVTSAGSTLVQLAVTNTNTTAANAAPTANDLVDSGAAFSKLPNYSGGKETIILEGSILTTTAGVIRLDWAQAASVATNTTVNAGSYLTIQKL